MACLRTFKVTLRASIAFFKILHPRHTQAARTARGETADNATKTAHPLRFASYQPSYSHHTVNASPQEISHAHSYLTRENAWKLRIALLRTLASAAGHPGFWLGCLAIATWLGYGVWAFYLEGQAGALPGPRVAQFLRYPPDATAQDEMPDAQLPVEIDGFSSNIMAASANVPMKRFQELRK